VAANFPAGDKAITEAAIIFRKSCRVYVNIFHLPSLLEVQLRRSLSDGPSDGYRECAKIGTAASVFWWA
jgi:hypothetical protein